MLELTELNRPEAIRYLGSARVPVNDTMTALLDECEELVLDAAVPKFRYEVRDLPWPEIMAGGDVAAHLKGCEKAVLLCTPSDCPEPNMPSAQHILEQTLISH